MHALLNDLRITLRSLGSAPGIPGPGRTPGSGGALVGLGGTMFAARVQPTQALRSE